MGRSQQAADLQDMQGIEDTSILEDLAEAEEEYDKPEQVHDPLNLLRVKCCLCHLCFAILFGH